MGSLPLSAISFDGLTKCYNELTALDSLDLSIQPGELFGFLGPNGAGKTTAMKAAAGLIKPTSGRVLISGKDVQQDPSAAKRMVGYVPDNPFIYETLTGREFLHFCSGLYNMTLPEAESAVERMQEWFAIGAWIDKRAAQYSHGMKQRIVMASAFLHKPDVILIDEPMVGLDPAGVRLVKGVLRQFCQNGGTVFLSTHTLADAEELCDRIGIISQGRLVASGTVPEIRRDGQNLEEAFLELTAEQSA